MTETIPELQQLQELTDDHDPQSCQPWRGPVGLCRGCTRTVQTLLVVEGKNRRRPLPLVELLATLRGLLGPAQQRQRPASGPDLVGLTAERDAALALLGRIGPHVPEQLRAAALQQLAELLGPQGEAALRTAQLAVERGGAEGGRG
jgi:hypothetical protein